VPSPCWACHAPVARRLRREAHVAARFRALEMTAGGDGATPPCPAAYIGMRFVKDYYTMLAKEPERVHKFYKAQSVFSRGAEGAGSEDVVSAVGPSEIHSEIMACVGAGSGGRACYAEISHVESQESFQGGVLVLVTGYLTYSSTHERQHFTQALFLEPQEQPYNGYFVLNDILRYIPRDASSGKTSQAPPPVAPPSHAKQPAGSAPAALPRPQPQSQAPWHHQQQTATWQPVQRQTEPEQHMPMQPPPSQPPIRPPQERPPVEEASPPAASSEADQRGDEPEEVPDAEDEAADEDEEEAIAAEVAAVAAAVAAEDEERLGETAGAHEEAKPAEPQAKSWAERVAASRAAPSAAVAPPKRGFPPPTAVGGPVLPPPTAAAKAEAARVVQRQHAAAAAAAAAAVGSDAPSAGSASTPAPPKEASPSGASPPGSVRLWLSRLPPEKVTDSQELLDNLNNMLAEAGMASGKALEVDRKEASGKDWGYLVLSSQEVADQIVQFSKEKKIILQNRTLKAELIKQNSYSGGGSRDSTQRRTRGYDASAGSPGGKGDDDKRRFGTEDSGRKGVGRKGGKGGGKDGYGEEHSGGGKHGGGRKGKTGKGEGKGTWRAMNTTPVGGGATSGGGGSAS